jgi:hypothetical protein
MLSAIQDNNINSNSSTDNTCILTDIQDNSNTNLPSEGSMRRHFSHSSTDKE